MAATLCAGVAVDYTRLAHTKSVMTNSLDAAVLATGNLMTSGETNKNKLRREFDNFFFANLENRKHQARRFDVASFSADPVTGKVSATATADVKMAFMGLVGTEAVAVDSAAEARFSTDAVEIAMVLDVTGSMRGSKMQALKDAAIGAVDILLPNQTSSNKVRVGLVPYSWSVNAGNRKARLATGGASRRCVTERSGANAFTDAGFRRDPLGADPRAVRTSACPRSEVRGLTKKRSQLISDIRGLKPEGYTAGHIGISWSYYMLSENWRNLWRGDEKPLRYEDPVKKVAILMTDGEFNTYYSGTSGNAFGPYKKQSNTHATGLCDDMKSPKGSAAGITIYSVAFKAPASAQATLKSCATPDEGNRTFYFNADSEAELLAAFQAIAVDIQKLRLAE